MRNYLCFVIGVVGWDMAKHTAPLSTVTGAQGILCPLISVRQRWCKMIQSCRLHVLPMILIPPKSCKRLKRVSLVPSLSLIVNIWPREVGEMATVVIMEVRETLTSVGVSKTMAVETTSGLLNGLLANTWRSLLACKRHVAVKRKVRAILVLSIVTLIHQKPIHRHFPLLGTICELMEVLLVPKRCILFYPMTEMLLSPPKSDSEASITCHSSCLQ